MLDHLLEAIAFFKKIHALLLPVVSGTHGLGYQDRRGDGQDVGMQAHIGVAVPDLRFGLLDLVMQAGFLLFTPSSNLKHSVLPSWFHSSYHTTLYFQELQNVILMLLHLMVFIHKILGEERAGTEHENRFLQSDLG